MLGNSLSGLAGLNSSTGNSSTASSNSSSWEPLVALECRSFRGESILCSVTSNSDIYVLNILEINYDNLCHEKEGIGEEGGWPLLIQGVSWQKTVEILYFKYY